MHLLELRKGINNMKKKITSFTLAFCLLFTCSFAHSGRTDASGGHRDNKNVSGLGYYHYHCGGNPPHLHTNGVCPYSTPKVTYPTLSTSVTSTVSSTSAASKPINAPSNPTNKIQVDKPTYPVKINNEDISNFAFGWSPFVYKDITYIPLTSYLVNELNLKLDFNNEYGLNLSSHNNSVSDCQDLFLASSILSRLDKNLLAANLFYHDCHKAYYLTYINKELGTPFQQSVEVLNVGVNSVNSLYDYRDFVVNICVEYNLATLNEVNEMFDNIKYYPICLQQFANSMSTDIISNQPFKDYSAEMSLCENGLTDITNTLNKIQTNISDLVLN
jgi:hypothetical protein